MKRFTIWFLFIAFAIRPLYFIGCYSYYAVNLDTIVAEFCENKQEPELQCLGKCHLSKQIIGNADISLNEGDNTIIEAFFPVFYQPITLPKETHIFFTKKAPQWWSFKVTPKSVKVSLFRPPRCA